MTNRPARPQGASWVTPYIVVKDVDASINFYEKAFGFHKQTAIPDDSGTTMHAELKFDILPSLKEEDS